MAWSSAGVGGRGSVLPSSCPWRKARILSPPFPSGLSEMALTVFEAGLCGLGSAAASWCQR